MDGSACIYLSRTSHVISKSECSHSYRLPPSMYSMIMDTRNFSNDGGDGGVGGDLIS